MICQVLIVDDEEIVCRGLREFVKWADLGFEVAGIAYSVDEALLDKLHRDIARQTQNAVVQRKRTEGLLLSLARGYVPFSQELYQIPEVEGWYGLSIGMKNSSHERNLEKRMESLWQKLSAVFEHTIVLPYEAAKLFLILPCESPQELRSVISLLESLFHEDGVWACGISSPKVGISQIAESILRIRPNASVPVCPAEGSVSLLRGFRASLRGKHLRCFRLHPKTLCLLTDSSTRDQAKKAASNQLFRWFRDNKSLVGLQLFCIQSLIEMKGHLENVQIEQSRGTLNDALVTIMRCGQYEEVVQVILAHDDLAALHPGVGAVGKPPQGAQAGGVEHHHFHVVAGLLLIVLGELLQVVGQGPQNDVVLFLAAAAALGGAARVVGALVVDVSSVALHFYKSNCAISLQKHL